MIKVSATVDTSSFLASLAEKIRSSRTTSCRVGFKAPYSIYVHENLEAQHTNGKAKFLTDPLARNRDRLNTQIASDLVAGRTWQESLLAAGEVLKTEAQAEVPVDTGLLKSSAYVEISG